MQEKDQITVPQDVDKMRLDKFLAEQRSDLSRSRLQSLIQSGDITLDGEKATPSVKIFAGQVIDLVIPEADEADPKAENIPLDIVFEDDHMIVLNKAVGMVVHPGAGNRSGTLVNALLHHCGDSLSGIGGVKRPGIVHRLDKETSGLMIVAKNDKAHRFLAAQLADRSLSRTYLALVWGVPQPPAGLIDLPIARHPSDRTKMAIRRKDGREAQTRFRVKERYGEAASLVECKLQTGRTHQIRVHMQAHGYELVGDPIYGAQKTRQKALLIKNGCEDEARAQIISFGRQALHAASIAYIHPETQDEMSFSAPFPEDLEALAGLFRAL